MPINNAFTRWLAARVAKRAAAIIANREPDFVVGGRDDPYLRRWWLIPRNSCFNIYLHSFEKSDEDRACHDHPFASLSLALSGSMSEIYLQRVKSLDGTVVIERERPVAIGDVIYRQGKFAHRMVVPVPGAATIFITGPRFRPWGFFCGGTRFVPWREFVDDRDRGAVGRGCD